MNKTVVLFTATFPYGTGESFLESEIKYYKDFSKIIIITVSATSKDKETKRALPLDNIEVLSLNGDPLKRSKIISFMLKTITCAEFWKDLIQAINSKGVKGIIDLCKFTCIGEERVNQLKKLIKDKKASICSDNAVFYSYWMHLPLYVCLRTFGTKNITVTRCHGFDIYEYRNGGYIPYRKYLLSNVDKIACVSEDGKNYLENKYPYTKNKLAISRLGILDNGEEYRSNNHSFKIVSCSRVVALKRINYIIEALSLLDNRDIEWFHIGDGPLLEEMKDFAHDKLANTGLKYSFLGEMKNSDVIELYRKEYFDCFINVSTTEGVPVSVMEAMSFGIPILATDVGGTSEIVKDGSNGILLKPDCSPKQISEKIESLIDLSKDNEIRKYRKASRILWNQMCNADVNYKSFVSMLYGLIGVNNG